MAEKGSKADYLKAAEIMASLGKGYAKQVVYFLDKAGLCDEEFMRLFEEEEAVSGSPGRKKNIDPEFVALLNEMYALRDDVTFEAIMKYFRTEYGIQKERFFNWMEGKTGISDELKKRLMPEVQGYIKGKKSSQEFAEKIEAERKEKAAKQRESTSP